jgi:hypothetical protein
LNLSLKKLARNLSQEKIKVQYHSIDPELDTAFNELYKNFYSLSGPGPGMLVGEALKDFEAASFEYFDRSIGQLPVLKEYFQNLTPIWGTLMKQERFTEAQFLWRAILNRVRRWESRSGHRIHKGSALYFWGVTAIEQGQIDKGFLLMHSAYREDVETKQTKHPPTPAFWFVTLDYKEPKQLYFPYVEILARFLEDHIVNYCLMRRKHFSLDEFRDLFLLHPPSQNAVFWFTHSLARIQKLMPLPWYSLHCDFTGQYGLNLFFDFALLIEEALASQAMGMEKFIDLAEYLSSQAGLNLSKDRLGEVNSDRKNSCIGFDKVVLELLDSIYRFNDGYSPNGVEKDITVAYCVRNQAAHYIAPLSSVWSRYEDILKSLLNTLFLTVDVLYR